MNHTSLLPLLRQSVGYDHLYRTIERAGSPPTYPPYNIEQDDADHYRIVLAVAGFSETELSVTAEADSVRIAGKKAEEANKKYLHRGLSTRDFERRFELADHIRVNGAALRDGLLIVDLVREVPEAMKPRVIPIGVIESASA